MAKLEIEKHFGQEACQLHVFNFHFRREIFETHPNCTKVTHSVFTWYILPYLLATKHTYTG